MKAIKHVTEKDGHKVVVGKNWVWSMRVQEYNPGKQKTGSLSKLAD